MLTSCCCTSLLLTLFTYVFIDLLAFLSEGLFTPVATAFDLAIMLRDMLYMYPGSVLADTVRFTYTWQQSAMLPLSVMKGKH